MKKLLSTFFTLAIVLNLYGQDQDLPDYGCTPSNQKAYFTVEHFLTMDFLKEERIKTGTDGISVSEIRHVDNIEVCIKLTSILDSNPNYLKIKKGALGTLFFYQTNNFYYIFWSKLNTLGGVKRKFIVVNKEYKVVGEFYI